ncbi:MAG: hypothetical protein EOP11_09850, partial [Proteobacteria bacterium]
MLLSLSLLLASLASAEPRTLDIAPAHGSLVYSSSAAEESFCTISLGKPAKVEILSETETHFEV